jgi:mycothiol system anti-sigma-R factor
MQELMDCKAAAPMLHAYLDGELDRAAVDEIEEHLERCEQCVRELASLQALRDVIREGAPRHAAPASLRAQLLASGEVPESVAGQGLDRVLQKRRPTNAAVVPRWAMAASLLMAFSLGIASMKWYATESVATTSRHILDRELLSSHLRALAAASPVDVVSTNRHTVKPWFAGKIGQSPPVLDLAADGFPLVGGRIDYVANQRVAVLVYGHGQHLIDVYLLPATVDDLQEMPRVLQGYRLAAIRVQEQPMWIVGDIDEQEFARFKNLLTAGVSR